MVQQKIIKCECGCGKTSKTHPELAGTHYAWECWETLDAKKKKPFIKYKLHNFNIKKEEEKN